MTASRPVVLVTGASRGIGRAVAVRMAADHDLLLLARSAAELDEVAGMCRERGAHAETVVADLTDFLDVARRLTGRHVDVLVNNAGIVTRAPLLEMTAEQWHRTVDVNINALYHVTRAVLPGMVERARGHVCTIGSLAGRNAFAGGSVYTGSKHFVMGFSESLMLEVRDRSVGVSVVMPGSVDTSIFPSEKDRSWMLEPEDVAEAVAYVVAAPPHALVSRVELRPRIPNVPRPDRASRAR